MCKWLWLIRRRGAAAVPAGAHLVATRAAAASWRRGPPSAAATSGSQHKVGVEGHEHQEARRGAPGGTMVTVGARQTRRPSPAAVNAPELRWANPFSYQIQITSGSQGKSFMLEGTINRLLIEWNLWLAAIVLFDVWFRGKIAFIYIKGT